MGRISTRCDWLAIWILWSAWAQAVGWGLSALGHLDRGGYAVAILVFGAAVFMGRDQLREDSARPLILARRSTCARWLPRLWLGLALLAFIGGALHPPDNFDYLTYRFPRLLHWWWDGHWSWLNTPDDRQNTSAVAMEWLMAPLLVLFHTDRLYFLINIVSYLFLPGLIFTVFRGAGVSSRVSWSWMWLLPAGFCYILQAASMGNDTFAAVYFLAALHYARRAGVDAPLALPLSILALALVTGAKASNIPLALPWLALLWMQRRAVLASVRPVVLIAALLIGAVASFLPIAVSNIYHTGSYTGDPANLRRLQLANPLAGLVGNTVEVVSGNLAPPIWPGPFRWPGGDQIQTAVGRIYPRLDITGVPFQIDETAGLGPGLVLLSALGLIYGLRRRAAVGVPAVRAPKWLFAGCVAVAWLGYFSKMGSEAAPRLVAVYYVAAILMLLVVVPVAGTTIHRLPWRVAAALIFAMSFPLIVLNPARPVLPVPWIDGFLRVIHAPSSAVDHLDTGYRLRSQRRDELHELRQAIPAEEKAIGVMGGDDEPAVSLWLPFGSRQAVELFPNTSDPAAVHLRYVAVSGDRLREDKVTLEDLLKKWSMTVVARQDLRYTLRRESQTWYLLRASN